MTATLNDTTTLHFNTSVDLPGFGSFAAADVTYAQLYCGCVAEYNHHNVEVDMMAVCRESECPMPADNLGVTAVMGVLKTQVVKTQ